MVFLIASLVPLFFYFSCLYIVFPSFRFSSYFLSVLLPPSYSLDFNPPPPHTTTTTTTTTTTATITTTTNTGTTSTRAFQRVSVKQNESTKFSDKGVKLYTSQEPTMTKSKYMHCSSIESWLYYTMLNKACDWQHKLTYTVPLLSSSQGLLVGTHVKS